MRKKFLWFLLAELGIVAIFIAVLLPGVLAARKAVARVSLMENRDMVSGRWPDNGMELADELKKNVTVEGEGFEPPGTIIATIPIPFSRSNELTGGVVQIALSFAVLHWANDHDLQMDAPPEYEWGREKVIIAVRLVKKPKPEAQ